MGARDVADLYISTHSRSQCEPSLPNELKMLGIEAGDIVAGALQRYILHSGLNGLYRLSEGQFSVLNEK